MKIKNISLVAIALYFLQYLTGCEVENPGEPAENLPPDTYISEASAGTTTRISFYGTDKDGFVDRFTYKWTSDEEWAETTENQVIFENVFTDQEEAKVFRVRSYDNHGLQDPTPAEISLLPNNVLPETEISSGPEFGKTVGEDLLFTFEGRDMEENGWIVKYEYTMDDLENWQDTPVDLPQAIYLGLATGAHVFYVRAVDNLGGKDPSPAQVAFVVKGGNFAPRVEVISTVQNGGEWFTGIPLNFAWEASVSEYGGILPESPYSYSIDDSTNFDNNPTAPLSSGWQKNTFCRYDPSEGSHTFYLKTRDSAGGIALISLSFLAATAVFDRGVLVVNGVSPAAYGDAIISRINQSAFWGSIQVDFWDIFGDMSTPDPSFTLPAGIDYAGGGGAVPVDILKQYSTVVWLGNAYMGDFAAWDPTLISAYLTSGGNVVLATRWGADFLPESLTGYLNIEWREGSVAGLGESSTAEEYVAVFPGLADMTPFTGAMNHTTVFSTYPFDGDFDNSISDADITDWDGSRGFSKDDYTTLLFVHRSANYDSLFPFAYTRGLGVWRHPNFAFSSLDAGDEYPMPGSTEAQGNFILLNGRNYRYDMTNMTANFEFILKNMCGEQ